MVKPWERTPYWKKYTMYYTCPTHRERETEVTFDGIIFYHGKRVLLVCRPIGEPVRPAVNREGVKWYEVHTEIPSLKYCGEPHFFMTMGNAVKFLERG